MLLEQGGVSWFLRSRAAKRTQGESSQSGARLRTESKVVCTGDRVRDELHQAGSGGSAPSDYPAFPPHLSMPPLLRIRSFLSGRPIKPFLSVTRTASCVAGSLLGGNGLSNDGEKGIMLGWKGGSGSRGDRGAGSK